MVPAPVLGELQGLADAGDPVRRAKGRRGLEVLDTLRRESGVDVEVLDDEVPAVPEVDAKLVRICLDRGAALLTLDTNLAKVASLAGVRVMNLHALALALRPPVSAGDEVAVLLIKAGKEPGQAVGYLDDGTMVVAERSRDDIGQESLVRVTSVLTTANGRMVFAKPAAESRMTAPVVAAVVPAAGLGQRLGAAGPKAMHLLGGEPMLVHSVRTLAAGPVDLVVVAAAARRTPRRWPRSSAVPTTGQSCSSSTAPRPGATRCALPSRCCRRRCRWCWCTTRPARSCRARSSTPWWRPCAGVQRPSCPDCR